VSEAMGAVFRSWWQQIKTHPVTTVLISLFVTLFVLVILGGYKLNWDWTGFNGNNKSGKTLWEWLQLLIIPFALAIIAILFNRTERKNEQRVASDNQQETALQEYIKEMSELLLDKNLRGSQPGDEVRTIARVRTLTVLQRLDAERKGSVLQFIQESGLIDKNKRIINLTRANLRGANLSIAELRGADLSEANLSGALVTYEQLSQAKSLKDATMPDGSIHT
jgi:Pentapeptide repeats (8 copies)